MEDAQNHIWKLLWEYDPSGVVVVDADLYIKMVNPSLCRMFGVNPEDVIGQPAVVIFDDVTDLRRVWQQDIVIRGQLKEYVQPQLYVNEVIFAIADAGVIVCIMVDMSHELERKRQLEKLKYETVQKVNEVVDKQMKVVQEIAGLLGETTAETKVSLLKIIQMLGQNTV
uniref:Putative PAS/PAC sensor protein n=1 Tax=Cyanothece sp. (strain PCC 7425 / ATCC 29141) TaxID=395961 RepID=B8HVQ0_CYAP4